MSFNELLVVLFGYAFIGGPETGRRILSGAWKEIRVVQSV